MIPEYIDKYRIQEELGKGAMGSILLGFNPDTEQYVAIKILPPEYKRNKTALLRFQQEAKIAARIRHPNVIQIHDAGYDKGKDIHFIVAEYVEGENLADLLQRQQGKIDQDKALHIIRCVVLALKEAEKHGIVHRDIKPANIMISLEDERVKLADLGIAKIKDSELEVTSPGHPMGTPYYMSPEQIREDPSLDGRSDIWSLGATFYHILSGEVPFDAGSEYELKVKIDNDPTPYLCDLFEDVPKDLADVVYKMMAKDPDDRYQNPSELLAALDDEIGKMKIPKIDRDISIPVLAEEREENEGSNYPSTVGQSPNSESGTHPKPRMERKSNPVLLLTYFLIAFGVVALLIALFVKMDFAKKSQSISIPPNSIDNKIENYKRKFMDEIEEERLSTYAPQQFTKFEKAVQKSLIAEDSNDSKGAIEQKKSALNFLTSTRTMADSNRNKLQKSALVAIEIFKESMVHLPESFEEEYPFIHGIVLYLEKILRKTHQLAPLQFDSSEDLERAQTLARFGIKITQEIGNIFPLVNMRNEHKNECTVLIGDHTEWLESSYDGWEELRNKILIYKDYDKKIRARQGVDIIAEKDVQILLKAHKIMLTKSTYNWEKTLGLLKVAIIESEATQKKDGGEITAISKWELEVKELIDQDRLWDALSTLMIKAKVGEPREAVNDLYSQVCGLISERLKRFYEENRKLDLFGQLVKYGKTFKEIDKTRFDCLQQQIQSHRKLYDEIEKAMNLEWDGDTAHEEGNFKKAKQLYDRASAVYYELNMDVESIIDKVLQYQVTSQMEKYNGQTLEIPENGGALKPGQEIRNDLDEKKVLLLIESIKLRLNSVDSPEMLQKAIRKFRKLNSVPDDRITKSKKIKNAINDLGETLAYHGAKVIFLEEIEQLRLELVKSSRKQEINIIEEKLTLIIRKHKGLVSDFPNCQNANRLLRQEIINQKNKLKISTQ